MVGFVGILFGWLVSYVGIDCGFCLDLGVVEFYFVFCCFVVDFCWFDGSCCYWWGWFVVVFYGYLVVDDCIGIVVGWCF